MWIVLLVVDFTVVKQVFDCYRIRLLFYFSSTIKVSIKSIITNILKLFTMRENSQHYVNLVLWKYVITVLCNYWPYRTYYGVRSKQELEVRLIKTPLQNTVNGWKRCSNKLFNPPKSWFQVLKLGMTGNI